MAKPYTPPLREWVPSSFLMIHDEHVRTTVRYSPMHLMRATDVTYRSQMKVYGRSPTQPIWSAESAVLHLDDVFAIDSETVARATGQTQLFSYGECYNWSPEITPQTPNTAMNIHMHFTSDNGSLQGHLGSFFIFGAPRQVETGQRHYESFPGALIDGEHSLSAYVLNPFVRPTKCRVHVVEGEEKVWTSPEFTIRGKGAGHWNSASSTFPGAAGPVGLIVETELKTSSFFGQLEADGVMLGLDHGHPFLKQVLAS